MSIAAATSAWTDVSAQLLRGSGLAILPFGALEQHGPHLPLSTDTMTADHLARRISSEIDSVLLPPMSYGATWNNAGYPGTVSLSDSTVTAIALDVAGALAESGARALVIVNGDWGNRAPLALAARQAVLPVLVLDHPGMDAAIASVRESRPAAPGLNHAEEIETSIMLSIAADTVHTDRYEACYPEFPADFGTRPMQLHPFSPSGVFGDPSSATAAKGATILAATLAASLVTVQDFLARLPPREDGRA